MAGPTYHGRTHLPGGTDPIPITTGASLPYSPPFIRWDYQDFLLSEQMNNGVLVGDFVCTDDATAPFGGYVEASSTSDDPMLLGMPLGPRHSMWAVAVWNYRQTGGGTLTLEWTTVPTDEAAYYVANGFSKQGTSASIVHPRYFEGLSGEFSYFTSEESTINTGLAGPNVWNIDYDRSAFAIHGADGSMLSANAVSFTNAGAYPDSGANSAKAFLDGGGDGSVYWFLRIRISVAGPVRIAGVKVYRRPSDLGPIA